MDKKKWKNGRDCTKRKFGKWIKTNCKMDKRASTKSK